MATVRLISCENREYVVDVEIVKLSTTLRNLLDTTEEKNSTGSSDETNNVIPLNNIKSDTLEKILLWGNIYKANNERNGTNVQVDVDVNKWIQSNITNDQIMLNNILMAANYLEIEPFLDAVLTNFAGVLNGKTADELSEILGLKCDFTQKELLAIQKENEYARTNNG